MTASILSLPFKQVSAKFCLLIIILLHFQAATFFLFSSTDVADKNSCLLKKIHIISTISSINSLHHLVETFYKNATNAFVISFTPASFFLFNFGEVFQEKQTNPQVLYFKLPSVDAMSGCAM